AAPPLIRRFGFVLVARTASILTSRSCSDRRAGPQNRLACGGTMNVRNILPVIAALALTVAIPAVACDGHSKTASASADHCGGMSRSTAWAGAWMERSDGGQLTVVAVAEGSPAAKSGLRAGDVVLARERVRLHRTARQGHEDREGEAGGDAHRRPGALRVAGSQLRAHARG